MIEHITSLPWSVLLPITAVGAFAVGIIWKTTQDRAVTVVKNLTLKPGDLSVSDLQEYARTHTT